jgi:hypothetical protein
VGGLWPKAVWDKSSSPTEKQTENKRTGAVAQGKGPKFKPQYHKKKKKKVFRS